SLSSAVQRYHSGNEDRRHSCLRPADIALPQIPPPVPVSNGCARRRRAWATVPQNGGFAAIGLALTGALRRRTLAATGSPRRKRCRRKSTAFSMVAGQRFQRGARELLAPERRELRSYQTRIAGPIHWRQTDHQLSHAKTPNFARPAKPDWQNTCLVRENRTSLLPPFLTDQQRLSR